MVKIKWKADFCHNSGYSEASRQYCLALKMLNADLITDDFNNMFPRGFDWMADLSCKNDSGYFTITHSIPHGISEGYYTVFEFDQAPKYWEKILAKAKLVLTASEYSKNSLATVCDKNKIRVINHGVNPKFTKHGNKLEFNENLPKFKFLSVFEWVERKCADRMIKAFTQAFKPTDDVCLILKAVHPFKPVALEINKIAKDYNVYLMQGYVDDMSTLYRAADCYLSPTGGEGWGETLSEAMACGVPTIGSRNGGNMEFMNDNNSFLVEVDDWTMVGEALGMTNLIKPWFKIKPPKIESIVEVMKTVYAGGDEVKKRAKAGEKVGRDFTWEKAARKIIQHVEEVQK